MNGIQYALRRVHEGENDIVTQLLRLAERHHAEHEVHHVARDLASWSQQHVAVVSKIAANYELDLDAEAEEPLKLTEQVRAAVSSAMGRRPEAGLLLLEDLRGLYLRAAENSLAWEMLAQVAQAKHELELLNLTKQCHPQTLRQMRWVNTMLKTQSPQALASL
jgi:hypothetical protein